LSQRNSEYARKERDLYVTPPWCVHALVPHLMRPRRVWEPAAANGQMAAALRECGLEVVTSDIATGTDFLAEQDVRGVDHVITNPPYALAQEFIEHALKLMCPGRGAVAMLLSAQYDFAKTRQHLFGPPFAKKLALTRRIVWFEPKIASPSENHCWMIWDWQYIGPPTLAYGS
jgi:hypothetical protein